MRKLVIGALAGAMFFAIAAVALALSNNTATYKVTLGQSKKASAKTPANLTVATTLDVGTSDGKQPDTAPKTDLYFAKGSVLNSKKFASCTAKEIDNQTNIPAKCEKARIGTGNATAVAGAPGSTPLPAFTENLTVTAFNGAKGKQVLLVLNGTAPLPIKNRVIVGTVGKAGGAYAYKIAFLVPPDLQKQGAAQVALTHLDVKIPVGKTAKVKVGKKSRKVSYVQLSKCPKSKKLPTRAVVHFNDDTGAPSPATVTSNGFTACK